MDEPLNPINPVKRNPEEEVEEPERIFPPDNRQIEVD